MKTITKYPTTALSKWARFLGAALMLALTVSAVAVSQSTAVNLGTAGDFVALAKTGISTTGTTAITGDIGISPAAASAITGFGLIMDLSGTFSTSSLVNGKVYAADYTAPTPTKMTTAIGDMETAYTDAAGRTLPDYTELYAGDVTGQTLTHGVYKWGTGVLISAGGVTISGSASDVWIFQVAQDLTVANGAIVTLSGGAQASNIFWQVAGQVTLGTTAQMKGIILCQTKIAMSTGASLDGRALAQTAVTLDGNAVTKPTIVVVPAVPVLVSPANKATNQLTTLTLKWNKSANALGYQCQLSANGAFSTYVVSDSSLTDTTKLVSGLLYNTTYYWRVRAYNSGAVSAFSAVDTFTTILAAPILAFPTSNAQNQPISLTLKWYKSSGALGYHPQVSVGSAFSTTVVNDSTADTTRAVTLTPNTKYYWRVQAYNAGGSSAYSGVDSFTTIAVPLAVTLVSPAQGATSLRADTLGFVWRTSATVTGYNFQLSANSGFTSFVKNDSTTDTTRKVTSLTKLTKYYWRVRGYNGGGYGAFSTVDSLTTIVPAPAAPVVISPSGTTNVPRLTTFKWHASTYATKYRLQIASSNAVDSIGGFKAANVLFDTTMADTVKQLSNPLAASTAFYWHVNASDTGGTSAYAAASTFTTGTVLQVGEFDAVPAKFALLQNYPNPFNPSTVISYQLPVNSMVTLKVYDILGKEVATLVNGEMKAGSYAVTFNANAGTLGLSSGVYIYRLEAGSFVSTKKFVLMK